MTVFYGRKLETFLGIFVKMLCLIERKRGFYKSYLSNRLHEKRKNIKKVEKALKYELRRREVEAMNDIAEDLEDAARRHNSKILYYHINKLRECSQFGLIPLKDTNGAIISDKERVKKRWVATNSISAQFCRL